MAYTVNTLYNQAVSFRTEQPENIVHPHLVLEVGGGQYSFSVTQASFLAIEILRNLGYEGTNGFRSISYDVAKNTRLIADKQAEVDEKRKREERLQKRTEILAMDRFDCPYSELNRTTQGLIMDLALAQRELEESRSK